MDNVQQSNNGSNSFNDYNDVNLTIRILFHGRVCIFIRFIHIQYNSIDAYIFITLQCSKSSTSQIFSNCIKSFTVVFCFKIIFKFRSIQAKLLLSLDT